MKKTFIILHIFLFSVFTGLIHGGKAVGHRIHAEIFPESNSITVKDAIQFPALPGGKLHFLLHGGLKIVSVSENVDIRESGKEIRSTFFGINTAEFKISKKIPVKHYELIFKQNSGPEFTIEYSGRIHHPVRQMGAEYARGFSETPGIISREGVYLAGSTFWIPRFGNDLVSFELQVKSPLKWSAVSQGRRVRDEEVNGYHISEWSSPEPMDEVYLVAAKFFKYKIKQGPVNIYAYMRSPDDNLAMKYLNTTGQYLEMYNKLIGLYPYSKFALIENFWETGYGMPSFTLLGSKIIRFPFILHSSYPHELLHNWWGNSVFVDYEKGNLCEGLTVFLADHLIKEQRGQGAEYRRTTLQGYTDYVNDENEFPVVQFRARSNASSSAIGYGKVMMIFNMLRNKLGDTVFINGIRKFYSDNKFRKAEFGDIEKAFGSVSGEDLSDFFHQWVNRKGAPELKLGRATVKEKNGTFKLGFSVAQVQKGPPFRLGIPAAVYLEGEKDVKMVNLNMSDKISSYQYSFKKRPLRIDIDPFFDVFRRLSPEEIPPSLSKIFGSDNVLIVLPEKEKDPALMKKYRELAVKWSSQRKKSFSIKKDSEMESLPSDRDIWLFGMANRFNPVAGEQLKQYGSSMDESSVRIGERKIDIRKNSIVLAVKNPDDSNRVIVLMSSDNEQAVSGLGRKLPHYGKYSYLSFSGTEPSNNGKGQWESEKSPLKCILDKKVKPDHRMPGRKPLGTLAPLFTSGEMMKTIQVLSGSKMEGRGLGTTGLDAAADYIAEKFDQYGLEPAGDPGFFQQWEVKTGSDNRPVLLKNVIGLVRGKNPDYADQSVLVTAHYDHLGRGWPDVRMGNEGKIHPGADDNASGIAVLLELARFFKTSASPERSILFIAFTGEENKRMGSEYFVNHTHRFPPDKMMGVINLDTVGRLKGKNPLVIGSSSAREWKFIFMGIGYTTGIESDLITQELDASDQISFVRKGVPGIQIFSGAHLDYHRPSDTPDKIDADGLVKIARIASEAVVYLSERKEPMTFTGKMTGGSMKPAAAGKGRKASIGIMPDFSHASGGVKVALAMKTSEGKDHLLKKEDVITALGGVKVNNLKEYSRALKKFAPGQKVTVNIIRQGKTLSLEIRLRSR